LENQAKIFAKVNPEPHSIHEYLKNASVIHKIDN